MWPVRHGRQFDWVVDDVPCAAQWHHSHPDQKKNVAGDEQPNDGAALALKAGTVTVEGAVKADTFFDPDPVAESYWELFSGALQGEVVYRQPWRRAVRLLDVRILAIAFTGNGPCSWPSWWHYWRGPGRCGRDRAGHRHPAEGPFCRVMQGNAGIPRVPDRRQPFLCGSKGAYHGDAARAASGRAAAAPR